MGPMDKNAMLVGGGGVFVVLFLFGQLKAHFVTHDEYKTTLNQIEYIQTSLVDVKNRSSQRSDKIETDLLKKLEEIGDRTVQQVTEKINDLERRYQLEIRSLEQRSVQFETRTVDSLSKLEAKLNEIDKRTIKREF